MALGQFRLPPRRELITTPFQGVSDVLRKQFEARRCCRRSIVSDLFEAPAGQVRSAAQPLMCRGRAYRSGGYWASPKTPRIMIIFGPSYLGIVAQQMMP